MSDLLAIGEALVELNQPKEGAPFVQGFGGDTSNAMIAAARLGADAAYFTAVGADRFGQALTELWLNEGVDASRIAVNGAAHTGLYFVTHGAQGHEFSYMRAGSAASRISESDLPEDRIRAAKILHVSGISQAISSSAADAVFAAIDIARDAKRLVSYDPNFRMKLWPLRRARAIIHEAMRSCDIALPGFDDGQALTGRSDANSIVDFYLSLGAPRGRAQARQGRRDRRDAEAARTRRRLFRRRGRRHGSGRLLRRRLPGRICPAERTVRRGAVRQCRCGALDPGLRRGRAAAPPRRRRGGGCGCRRGAVAARLFQIDPKFFKMQQSRPMPRPNLSK